MRSGLLPRLATLGVALSVAACEQAPPTSIDDPGRQDLSAGRIVDVGTSSTTLSVVGPAEITVDKARVAFDDDGDEFRVEGTLVPGAGGIDLPGGDVIVEFGTFSRTIPAGAFARDNDDEGWEFDDGLLKITIRDDGSFKVEAKGADLAGTDTGGPVAFSLQIGDDLGETTIQFGDDGKLGSPAAAPFPAGHVGYDVAISIDGSRQIFTPLQLQSTHLASSTQDAEGVVRLSTSLCLDFGCARLGGVRAFRPGFFPAGTVVNFQVLTIEGLPNADADAHCRLDRLPTFATIPGTFSPIPDVADLGDNVVTLTAAEPGGIVLHCEVKSDKDFI